MKVTLTADDGRQYDVTEHFLLLYDTATGSMDWGSGFLDGAEMLRILQAGTLLGDGVDVGEIVEAAQLHKEYPEPYPGPAGGAWGPWTKRRDEWVSTEAVRRYGDESGAVTFESLGRVLSATEAAMDDVSGFDE